MQHPAHGGRHETHAMQVVPRPLDGKSIGPLAAKPEFIPLLNLERSSLRATMTRNKTSNKTWCSLFHCALSPCSLLYKH